MCPCMILMHDSISNARKHIKSQHRVDLYSIIARKRSYIEEENSLVVQRSPQIKGLVQSVNLDHFRYYLVRWVVEKHIPFGVIEDDNFQLILKSINGTLKDHITRSGDTVRDWVE